MTREWVEKYLTKPSRLLVVSADGIEEVVAASLRDYDCDVVRAQNTDRAAYLLRTHKFDVIFLDMALPDQGGQDVLREIKYHCADTPVVVLTSFFDASVMEEATKLGIVSFMKKPTELCPDLFQQVFGLFKIRAVPSLTGA